MPFDVGLVDGDLPAITQHITGADLVVQRIRIRLGYHLGEFILDITKGLPFLAAAQTTPPDVEAFGGLVRAIIEDTPGVGRVETFTSSLQPSQSGAGQVFTYTGTIIAQTDSDAERELIELQMGFDLTGTTTPALVTYHRLGRIAP